MFTIENHLLKAVIDPKGAELTSLTHKENGLEYMWNADPAFWAKHSPVLFPIVGSLKDNTYFYRDQSYQLSRHGFAREQSFSTEAVEFDSITFLLTQNEASRKVFPFDFQFRIRYSIVDASLSVTYEVINPSKEDLYFSVGGHPAFKLPLAEGTHYNDYYLQFNQTENTGRWPIAEGGLLHTVSTPLLQNTNRLPLDKKLFAADAIVLKGLHSSQISLRSEKTAHGFTVDFPGFPFLGIWAAPNADFLCIEPWCGIADSIDTSQQLTEKEGINKLTGGETFTRTWTVQLF